MSTSTQVEIFEAGDYVLTSKGNIGIIERPQRWVIGYHGTDGFVQTDNTLFKEKGNAELEAEFYCQTCIPIPNLVLLGGKTFPIWSDKLKKLKRLKIRTQQGLSQFVQEFDVEDAKTIIEIYKRNGIWFAIE